MYYHIKWVLSHIIDWWKEYGGVVRFVTAAMIIIGWIVYISIKTWHMTRAEIFLSSYAWISFIVMLFGYILIEWDSIKDFLGW